MATTAAEPLFADVHDYVESPELKQVAAGLINRHPLIQGVVSDLRIAFLVRTGEPAGAGEDAIAKCQKVGPLWRDLSGYDVVIWVWSFWWNQFDQRRRESVALHELLHIDRTEKGGVVLRKHDLEEFGYVVQHYGDWMPQIRAFTDALARYDEGAADPKVTRLPAGRERRRPGTREPVTMP